MQIEKQKMENAMSRLDRLNLIGEMAASIGHEIRNPLTTVRGYLQHFSRKKDFLNYIVKCAGILRNQKVKTTIRETRK